MKCIIGLGNPGTQYQHTRHNIGYLAVEYLRLKYACTDWRDSKYQGVISEGVIGGQKIILLRPTTYMNLSGNSVVSIVEYYRLDREQDIIVISDDIDMVFGKTRLRYQGSHGGQNGIKDIITKLGSDHFARLKIGIGRDPRYDVSDWVLSRFLSAEMEVLQQEVFPQVDTYIHGWLGDSI